MATLFVAEVRIHSKPPVRKTFVAYADNKEEISEGLLAKPGPWHELIAARPLQSNLVELTDELVNYGRQ